MKRFLIVATVIAALAATPAAHAASYDPEEHDNPLRLIAYPIHFVGKVGEYVIARPINWLVSQPATREWFGRTSNPRTDRLTGSPDMYQQARY
jgi:hypothetical protein